MQVLISDIETRHIERDPDDENAPLDDWLNQLIKNNWHPRVFIRHLPEFIHYAETLTPENRLAWVAGMHQVWERHEWVFDISAKKSLLELAAAWSAWPLVIAVGASLGQELRFDDTVIGYLRDAQYILGDVDAAINLAVAMQLACPAKQDHAVAHRHLIAWRDWRRCIPPAADIMQGDDDLHLEPLGHHHISDFSWQYYDPAIAELCCLPHFENAGEWHSWLNDIYAQGDQQIFAVIHRAWGFIGSVSLVLHGDIGFFSYWIGRDFQGYGFGPRAASRLLADAHRHVGMRCCYAKVYDYNVPSRKALEKIGFEDMGICAAAPDADQLFYRFGAGDASSRKVAELHALMDYLGSEVRAAIPLTNVVA